MRIYVEGSKLRITEHDILVAGSVGVNFVHFEFAEDWLGKAVMAVFEANESVSREVVVPPDGLVEIPWEVLPEPGVLRIGVYALDEGLMKPTIWSMPQTIYQGAEPADPPEPYESTPWQDAVVYMGGALTEAKAARDASQEAAREAAQDANDAEQAASNAAQHAQTAETAKQQAVTAAQDAQQHAASAEKDAEFLSQRSAVWVGEETPPDGYDVWINPEGEATEIPGGGGVSLTVDENGNATI